MSYVGEDLGPVEERAVLALASYTQKGRKASRQEQGSNPSNVTLNAFMRRTSVRLNNELKSYGMLKKLTTHCFPLDVLTCKVVKSGSFYSANHMHRRTSTVMRKPGEAQ